MMPRRASKNYRNGAQPPMQDQYHGFAFCFDQPLDGRDGKQGNRIFPGDDTARTFIFCNLVNALPPPGSTLINCNTAIIERDIPTIRDDRNGAPDCDMQVHGRTHPNTLEAEYATAPIRVRQ